MAADDAKPGRIRWQGASNINGPALAGYAGTLSRPLFAIGEPFDPDNGERFVSASLPGMRDRISYGTETEVKATAEEWLSEFASSLGAVFPPARLASAQQAGDACTPACWTPVNCPSCGRELPPRGRSVPLAMVSGCCDEVRHDPSVNPRHLWNEEEASA